MLKLFAILILFLVAILAVALNRAYKELPAIELKRRAREHNVSARRIYRAAVYEKELSLLLWIITILTATEAFVLLTRGLAAWLSFIAIAVILWLSFTLLPYITIPPAMRLAELLAPVFGWLINRLQPVLSPLVKILGHGSHAHQDTKLYQIEDLLDLLHRQTEEAENRIPLERLDMAARALTFGDVSVVDVMVPRRMVVLVNAHDSIGPILMDSLHKSGHSRFPVFEAKENNIVGTLYLKDIIDKRKGGLVSGAMSKQVYYVHEDYTLEQVLHAFLKTKHHLFIVIDKFEEVVGIITIEDVLEQIIGAPIVDEFDKYDDLRAVAEHLAKKEHDEKTTEVLE